MRSVDRCAGARAGFSVAEFAAGGEGESGAGGAVGEFVRVVIGWWWEWGGGVGEFLPGVRG